MKRNIITVFFCICYHLSFANSSRTIFITYHQSIVEALTSVRSSCETVRSLIGDKWPSKEKAQMAIYYSEAKKCSDILIADYEVFIPQWRYAKNHNLTVKNQLIALQKADSVMVAYFDANYIKYSDVAALNITTEIINLDFDTGKQIYQFVKGISDEVKKEYHDQVEQQRITVEFNGKSDIPLPTVSNPADKSDASQNTNKSTTKADNDKKPVKPV